jgi:charged multivesicular body protein 5
MCVYVQGTMMKEVVENQKNVMGTLDIDKLDDLRDEMDELKYESDYMNELLNRDYEIDVDEADLDDELGELEKELKAEKQQQKKKEVNNQQLAA